MPRPDPEPDWHEMVKIPAVDHEDRLIANLTVRQCAQFAGLVACGWLGYQLTRPWVSLLVFAVASMPVASAAVAVVLGRRDGLNLDRWLAAAWRHRRTAHHLVPTGPDLPAPAQEALADAGLAPLPLPAYAIAAEGTMDLGEHGRAVISRCGTVNFALRTPGEQRTLVAGFGRWLNGLAGPVQILVRTHRLDLTAVVARLRGQAIALPHPLLEDAALAHADFLAELAEGRELLSQQVLVVQRDTGTDTGAEQRVLRRAMESASLLGACEVHSEVLAADDAFAVLASACDPGNPVHPAPARPGAPVALCAEGAS